MASDERIESSAPILLVDDKREDLSVLQVALEEIGNCRLIRRRSALEGLRFLQSENVAAVLLDVQKPGTDGIEVAERIRQIPACALTPILIVTATTDYDKQTLRGAYSLGAVDFVFKPVDTAALKSKVSFFAGLFIKTAELERKTVLLEQNAQAEGVFMLEHALDAVVATDEESRVIFWNGHAEKLFGWSKSEVMGRDMSTLIIPPQFRERHRAGMARFIATGTSNPEVLNQRLEIIGLRRNGEEFLLELTVSSVKTNSGYHFYSFMRDISAVRRAKKQLLASETTLNQIFTESPSFMAFVRGPQFVFERANAEYLKLIGREDIIGKRVIDVLPEVESQGFIALLEEVYKTKKRFVGSEVPLVLQQPGKAPKQIYVDFVYQALTRPDGEVYGIAAQGYDVTEKVLSRKRIEESEQLFRTVTDNAASSLFVMDKNGHPTFMNPAAKKLTGYESLSEIEDKPLHYAVHYKKPDGSIYPMEECPIDNAQADLKPIQSGEEIFVDKKGQLYPVSYSVAPLEQNGEVVGSVLEFRDITDQKRAEAELLTAKEEAERANTLKSAFLANMSHEIRTPLGAMMGFADLLKDPGLTPSERQSFADILFRNAESLSVIINDILDFSKVEAGHLTLEYTDTYPDQIAADVVSLLRVRAQEKDLVFNYTHDPTSPRSIVADPVRVRQIVLNIVSNAVKFTQFGSVNLRSFACKTERGRDALCFEVSDTGIGIPKDQHENIFKMFVQADSSMTRRFGGTGLGLALSRSLARAMGGDVVLSKSEEGVGSTFLITIEDQAEKRNDSGRSHRKETRVPELSEKALEGIKILVVDDAPDNHHLIWRYLTKYGAIVESAENGLLGYRLAMAGDFDLVLMDIQMPVMDGYTATQKLREAGYAKPIVALTAHAMNEVRKKALNVGYTDHLTKPINPKELVSTIVRLTAP